MFQKLIPFQKPYLEKLWNTIKANGGWPQFVDYDDYLANRDRKAPEKKEVSDAVLEAKVKSER